MANELKSQTSNWLTNRSGNMVWHALILVTVLIPLASLTIDVPRYYTLRSRLQLAADAAAESASRCLDFDHFRNVGESRLRPDCVNTDSAQFFALSTQDLTAKGYIPALRNVAIDETADTVAVEASGTTTLFFGLTPQFTVNVRAVSSFRMDLR